MQSTTVILLVAALLIGAIVTWRVHVFRGRDAVWRQLAQEIDGEFIAGGFLGSSRVVAQIGESTAVLETYWDYQGEGGAANFTRIHAPLHNDSQFEFVISSPGVVDRIVHSIGRQPIQTGVPDLDRGFLVRANDASRARALLTNGTVRRYLRDHLWRKQPGLFGTNLELRLTGAHLSLEVTGHVSDIDRLRGLFRLFRATLEQIEL